VHESPAGSPARPLEKHGRKFFSTLACTAEQFRDEIASLQKEILMPHPPPCHGNEILWGNECIPAPNTLRIDKVGSNFTFVLEGVAKELLPHLEKAAGGQAQVDVKDTDPGHVTITSVPHGEASELVKRLQPNAPKLPD
jgi:hypothetical protein